jgi:hypothetical protein
MLKPHIKYLYGRPKNLFCLINHSQHCAKFSSFNVFNGNATKRTFVHPDGPLHAPCSCLSLRPARIHPGRRTPRLLRPSHRAAYTAPVHHVARSCCTKIYIVNICSSVSDVLYVCCNCSMRMLKK